MRFPCSPAGNPGDVDAGDGQGFSNGTRTLAADALVDWLAADPTGSGDADFLILGDLNSYAKEDPITAILAGADDVAGTDDDFVNLAAAFGGADAASFVFDGQTGTLDYALANASLAAQVTGAAEWGINADEADALDYNLDFGRDPAIFDGVAPARASDHDPVLVGLDLDGATPPSAETQQVVVWAAGSAFKGDPAFDLYVNGVLTQSDVAVPSAPGPLPSSERDAATNPFVFDVDAAIDIESVGVAFTNDRWAGTPQTDRNLFVSKVEFGGETYTVEEHGDFTPESGLNARKEQIVESSGAMFWNGELEFAQRQSVTVYASGENYLGNPKFDLLINGDVLAKGVEVASQPGLLPFGEREAAADAFRFKVDADLVIESVGVRFFNDRYAGERDLDRNLFIPKIEIDGRELRPDADAEFFKAGGVNATLQSAAENYGHLFANGTLLFEVDDPLSF